MSLAASPLTDLDQSAVAHLEEIDSLGGRSLSTAERRAWRPVAHQAIIVGSALVAYLTVRALAVGSETAAFENANLLLDFERALGFDWEAGIQQAALDRTWVVTGANWFYAFAFWPILIATLVYTWFWQRPLFRRFRNALFVSGLMGLAIFAAFPVAPPRFLSGYVDTLSVAARHQYIARPSWLMNENAALPSFHVGWVALSAVLLFSVVKAPIWRFVILLPVLIMAATVVVTGNHYVIDIIAGVAVSLAALLVIVRLERKPALPNNC